MLINLSYLQGFPLGRPGSSHRSLASPGRPCPTVSTLRRVVVPGGQGQTGRGGASQELPVWHRWSYLAQPSKL